MKASEKQDLTKKLVARLERQYGPPPETPERSVLDALLYAVCLEDASYEEADRSFAALKNDFHDLNEIRVSSVTELAAAFAGQSEPDLRAHRVRSILQYVFEDQFEFDLEAVRKKTQEQAAKKLGKVRDLSPFVRLHVQQAALGAHLVPMDDRMTNAAVWLGLVEPGTNPEAAAETLKSALRKADAPLFCHYLRCLTTTPPGRDLFAPESFVAPEAGTDASESAARLEELLGGKARGGAKAKPAAKKAEPKKGDAKAKAEKPAKAAAAKKKAPTAAKPAPGKKPAKGRSRAAS